MPQKLLKGGNYSREENICGTTVLNFGDPTVTKLLLWAPIKSVSYPDKKGSQRGEKKVHTTMDNFKVWHFEKSDQI